MLTKTESVVCVYDGTELIAMVKRDDGSKKNIIYLAREAQVDEIAKLINGEKETV